MASSFSQRRRKQPKPRHLNNESSSLPTELVDQKDEGAKTMSGLNEDQFRCENCQLEFHDVEVFLLHLKACNGDAGVRKSSQICDRNIGDLDEPDEMSENEGYSDSEFHLYRLESEQANSCDYLNNDTQDDDEMSVIDSQYDNGGGEESIEKEGSLTRENGDNQSDKRTDQKSHRPLSHLEENGDGRLRLMPHSMENVSLLGGDVTRLIGNNLSVPSKMLDIHQLYLVLIQLQQQQLLQLRMLNAIQKRLAENIMPTTGDIIAGLPELAIPRFGASFFGSLPAHPGFPANGLSHASSTSGDANSGRRQMEESGGFPSAWPGFSFLSMRSSSSAAAQQRSEATGEDVSRRADDAGEDAPLRRLADDRRTEHLPPSRNGAVLVSDQTPSSENATEETSSRPPMFSNLGSELSEVFKKGKLTSNLSIGQLNTDQPNAADGQPEDNAIFRHRCRLCLKVLGSDSALQIHMRSHTGERPYKCNICGNRFTTKGNLKVHFSRHQEQYPHIRMNPDPVPEHLDHLGHQPPPLPPSLPPSLPPPTSMLPHSTAQTSFYIPPQYMPLPPGNLDKAGTIVSPALIPSSAVVPAVAGNSGNMERSVRDDRPGNIKSEALPHNETAPSHLHQHLPETDSKEKFQLRTSNASNEAKQISKDMQSKVLISGDTPSSGGLIFPSPLTALSSMSSALPSLKSPLNLTFPGQLPMPAPGMGLLPPYRYDQPPAMLSFTRSSVSSVREDDPLEQFMEVQLSESGKLDELVKDSEGKVSDPNECAVCHRVLSCRSALQMHYRTHTGERPYRCKLCSRTFTTKGNLKTHMSVHRGKANTPAVLQCPVCSRDFTNPLILQQHMRVHANEPPKHIPLPRAHMMMPMLNHFLPFPINFPYIGPGFAPFQQPFTGFGRKELDAPLPDASKIVAEEKSNQVSNDGQPAQKLRKLSEADHEDVERLENEERAEERNESDEGENKLELKSERSAFGNQYNDSEMSEEGNEGTASNSVDDSTRDSDFGKYEESKSGDAYAKDGQQRPGSNFSTNAEAETESKQEEKRHANQSPAPSSSLPNYAAYSSLTGQYSSPLTALEERVNALGYPSHRFKQSLQSEHGFETNNTGGKAETSEKLEEESSGFPFRNGTPYRMLEQSTQMMFGNLGSAEAGKYGNISVSQSPGFHATPGSLELPSGGKLHVVCQVCGKGFACKSALEIHLRSHTKEKPFQCQICRRAFSTKGNLKQHILMTHSLSSEQEIMRNRANTPSSSDGSQTTRFSPPIGVNVHTPVGLGLSSLMLQQIGEGNGNNDGSVCLALSDQSNGVGVTTPDKKSVMRYLCSVCKKPFSSTSALEIHMRTHTGDRPFVCSLCNKAFTTKGNLKVHMGTHAWNKCPSRRGRRMLMDPLPNFQTPPKDGVAFGRFPQPSADTLPLAMLHFPEYFLQKPPGDGTIFNGFNDGTPVPPLSLKFDAASIGTKQSAAEAPQFQVVSPPPEPSGAAPTPAEIKTRIKEEEGSHRPKLVAPQDHYSVTSEVEQTTRSSPAMVKSYSDISTPPDTATQSSLLWPTDLSQGHQQVALNCR